MPKLAVLSLKSLNFTDNSNVFKSSNTKLVCNLFTTYHNQCLFFGEFFHLATKKI
jgi:hypothetical protein